MIFLAGNWDWSGMRGYPECENEPTLVPFFHPLQSFLDSTNCENGPPVKTGTSRVKSTHLTLERFNGGSGMNFTSLSTQCYSQDVPYKPFLQYLFSI